MSLDTFTLDVSDLLLGMVTPNMHFRAHTHTLGRAERLGKGGARVGVTVCVMPERVHSPLATG